MGIIRDQIENERIAKAKLNGDNTQPFKIADAVNIDEAISKGQQTVALATKLDVTATAVDATKWNGSSQSTSTAAASGGVSGDIWFQY